MKNKKNELNFKNVKELAYFTAETVIHKEFKLSKTFPKDWNYLLTETEVKHIPQKELKEEILNDIPSFNDLVVTMIHKRLEWLMAEGFVVDNDDEYRFLSDQEMQDEIDKILAE